MEVSTLLACSAIQVDIKLSATYLAHNNDRTIGAGANNELLTHDIFKKIAEAHSCSTAVVSLSWAVQRGITVIPKSSNKARIEENIKLVTLSEDEIATINDAHNTIGKYRIPDNIPHMTFEIDGVKTFMGWTPVDFGWEDEQGNWLT